MPVQPSTLLLYHNYLLLPLVHTMGSIDDTNFVLTAEALNKALPDMHPSTRGIHADDFFTPHRAIAPGMHTAVNFRYARDAEDLVPEENNDVSHSIASRSFNYTSILNRATTAKQPQ